MSVTTQSLRPQMERVRRAWRGSPLPRFFSWWGGELVALLPIRWRAAFAGSAAWHLLSHRDGQWSLRRAGVAEPLARWPDHLPAAAQQAALRSGLREVDDEDLRLALCLPEAVVLRRRLLLPEAARDSLLQVAGYEMDRQTPFRLEQVYYGVRELGEQAPAGRLAVELVVVPREHLDLALGRLREAGIAVDAVDLAVAYRRLGVDLLPAGQAPQRKHPRRRLNAALAVAALVLLVLLLGQWKHNREQALETMQAQVDAMRAPAQQVAALRQQWQDNAGAAGFLSRRKQTSVSVLSVLDELTSKLPETTWLERFTLDNSGRIGIQGQSVQAATLLDALKGARTISEPNFQGTIQPDPVSKKERFYMGAQLRVAKSADAARNHGAVAR